MIQPIRGTHDLTPDVYRTHRHIVETARHKAQLFGFQGMATPIIEPIETFQKPLGETSDIVGKEMYAFQDRGGTSLVLRPEGTAGIVRAVLHHGMHQHLPLRLFYDGPMFRYDRPQKGRQRQFHHIGAELLGDGSFLGDFEVLSLSFAFLQALHMQDRVTLDVNSLGDAAARARYRQTLTTYLQDHLSALSEESQQRLQKNPLRILDSKSPQDQMLLQQAPRMRDALSSQDQDRFEGLKNLLNQHHIPYREAPYLVRGLDYYDHTVFEWTTTELGAQATVLAGGCYQSLVRLMGGPDVAGVGWAAGVERLALMIDAQKLPETAPVLYVLPLSENEWAVSTHIAHSLRAHHLAVELWAQGPLGKRLKAVHRRQGRWALVIGEDEAQARTVMVRDLAHSTQHLVAVDQLIDYWHDALTSNPIMETPL